jgi:hypothetical protein
MKPASCLPVAAVIHIAVFASTVGHESTCMNGMNGNMHEWSHLSAFTVACPSGYGRMKNGEGGMTDQQGERSVDEVDVFL